MEIIKNMNSTENIIDTLKNLGNNLNEEDMKLQENRKMCRLINIQLRDFFDDIYIPYNFFRDGDWKISKILYDNEDILFYNKKYLTKEDDDKFYEIFDKLTSMLEEILTPNNKLYNFLKNWTDMSDIKWKSNRTKSYLKSLLTNKKYRYISPSYTANIYCDISKKYRDNIDKIKKETEKHLDEIVAEVKKEVKEFKKIYNEIVTSYVYEHPLNLEGENIYVLGFMNSIIITILNFADKLIDLNVYAVHPIIYGIICYYTPLDDINQCDLKNNGKLKVCIV